MRCMGTFWTTLQSTLEVTAERWGWIAAMIALILLSAFFSGSEAALFSLRDRDRRRLRMSGLPGQIADRLLQNPEHLLSAILFWNLLINMTYFAIAAIVGGQLESNASTGSTGAVLFTVGSLLAIIFLSEMLPKSIAVVSPTRFSIVVALPLQWAVRLISPALPMIRSSNAIARRLLWPTFRAEPELDLTDIERAIELGTDDAALRRREREVLRRLVSLSDLRADELMRPRGRLNLMTPTGKREVIQKCVAEDGYLYFADEDDEAIVSALQLRTMRPNRWKRQAHHHELAAQATNVIYAPWTAKIAAVFDQLVTEERNVAVIVNEFGESIGVVTMEDLLRHILGSSDAGPGGLAEIDVIGPDRWRLSGSVRLRSLVELLGVDEPAERAATVAGYIQRCNERLPRPGDSAALDRFVLTVLSESDDDLLIDVSAGRINDDGEDGTP
ncbi:hypothetical protein Pan14r_32110 [Crateriforma conspicua]|uniref:Magnesium and cobalt efflux protein CorC n=2 Tax=Crateriforma conspicua TaxID=2527996 RepID=A0A5C5Y7Z0_9PLAN|nr:hypothetical protein Mal65_46830 [Crateriforma conspicua]TWT70903.1 hypothetical protein Pan14r_32110 [Crateriforma conspicua]